MEKHVLFRIMSRTRRFALWGLALALLLPLVAHADRSSENMDPAWMYEKKGKYDKAALYYHRALRGLREIYLAFHWNGEPAANAPGKYSREYVQIPIEMEQRYKKCVSLAKLGPDQLKRLEYINYLWMSEMVDQEAGGQRTACSLIAPEAEKHGDFTLAAFTRRGEARYCRAVAIPFHERSAREFEKTGRRTLAALHHQAVKVYEGRAERADMLAKGNKALKSVQGLKGPDPWLDTKLYPAKVNPVSFQYLHKRLFSKDGQWKGPSPQQVAAILKQEGLKHADESVRYSTVNVLANLGEKEAVLSALDDSSFSVRLVAAKALVAMRWADGWAVCHRHSDANVRAVVTPLLQSADEDVLTHTFVITELISGLDSASAETRSFCQSALEHIAHKKMKTDEWTAWWKSLGSARPGLIRTGPGVPAEVDETIGFGAWWQSAYQHAPNPLLKYEPPATIQWDGYLIVTQPGQYSFYARNCGEGKSSRNSVATPGRVGFPGLYLPESSVRLTIDDEIVLPHPSDAVQDPSGIRLDFSESVRLDEGLHRIHLEFQYRSKRAGFWVPQPCLRLYWSSEHFSRDLVPAHRLVTFEASTSPQ